MYAALILCAVLVLTQAKLWRDDGRCGEGYNNDNGQPAQCHPNDPTGHYGRCCSTHNWCGDTEAHCNGGTNYGTWRTDFKCGANNPLDNGAASECRTFDAAGVYGPCCSSHGWCGGDDSYCKCSGCSDSRDNYVASHDTSKSDRLVIEKIECKRVATGIDNFAKAGAAAVGAFIAAGATLAAGATTVVVTGGAGATAVVPVTATAVASAAASGASGGYAAINFMDGPTSGTDHLVVNVNGRKVFPSHHTYKSMTPGDVIHQEISVDFNTGCEIQLIEYDQYSDNDSMGKLRVDSNANDKTNKGANYRIEQALVSSETEGSLYYVTYRVERGVGSVGHQWAMCGTATCKECSDNCDNTSNYGLDRDGDLEDLRDCPYPMEHRSYKHYPQHWPLDDVYLRVCSTPGAK